MKIKTKLKNLIFKLTKGYNDDDSEDTVSSESMNLWTLNEVDAEQEIELEIKGNPNIVTEMIPYKGVVEEGDLPQPFEAWSDRRKLLQKKAYTRNIIIEYGGIDQVKAELVGTLHVNDKGEVEYLPLINGACQVAGNVYQVGIVRDCG